MTRLCNSVAVITGASSGLGKALALELAGRGSSLVLGARRGDALEDTARSCRAAGVGVIAVEVNVTVEDEVGRLVAAALDSWGRIDVWINNAGVTLYALLDQAPFEQHQRVIETNLFGAMLGARAVLPVFRRQHRGVLINVGSVLSEIGHAYVPSYVISKFGVRGLSEALRVDLADEPDIHVCTVFPYAIDTPHFEVAANRIGSAPYAMPPMQSPEQVARAIAHLAEHPRRTRHVPRAAVLGLALHAILPRTTERLLLEALRRWHLGGAEQHVTTGNLFAPPPEAGRIHGRRPPRIGLGSLIAWLAWQLAQLELESAIRVGRRVAAWFDRRRRFPAAREVPEI